MELVGNEDMCADIPELFLLISEQHKCLKLLLFDLIILPVPLCIN
jgi:hypothetical protein